MPFSYTFDSKNHMIVIMGSGSVTMEERFDVVSRVLADPEVKTGSHVFIDVSRIENNPSPKEIQPISSLVWMLSGQLKGRVAIVNEGIIDTSKLQSIALSADRDGNSVRVFANGEEALQWLRAEAPQAVIQQS